MGDPVNAVWLFPATSVTANVAALVSVDVTAAPPAIAVERAVMVQTVVDVWTMLDNSEMFVRVKSSPAVVDKLPQSSASFPVTVNRIALVVAVAATAAKVTVGAIESGIVTMVDCGDPPSAVCGFPAVSVIENVLARVIVLVTAAPPFVAVDVAVMVHTCADVCTIPVIALTPVSVKSVPATVDNVVQVMGSSPVTVNVMVPLVDVEALAAKVTVGAVVSAVASVFRLPPGVCPDPATVTPPDNKAT